jgi:quinol monooxygenase YgiN
MTVPDTCCTLAPYFKVNEGQLAAFRKGCEAFVAKTRKERNCLFYGFSFSGDEVHCREGYTDAQALLFHLENVGQLLQEALKISNIIRLEVHGPEEQLALLREPLADLNPRFYSLDLGFRRVG